MSGSKDVSADSATPVAGEGNVVAFPLYRVAVRDVTSCNPELPESRSQEASSPVTIGHLRSVIAEIASGPGAGVGEQGGADQGEDSTELARARTIALRQLSVSGRSEAEVRERLGSRGVPPEAIEKEISALQSVGVIDDGDLARNLVDQLRARRKLSNLAIRQNLLRRKISADVIDHVMTDSLEQEEIALKELATRRARGLGHLDSEVATRRLIDYLRRRGYSGEGVFRAAIEALQHKD